MNSHTNTYVCADMLRAQFAHIVKRAQVSVNKKLDSNLKIAENLHEWIGADSKNQKDPDIEEDHNSRNPPQLDRHEGRDHEGTKGDPQECDQKEPGRR